MLIRVDEREFTPGLVYLTTNGMGANSTVGQFHWGEENHSANHCGLHVEVQSTSMDMPA